MSLSAGIIGLPNVGKSTLFNAITNSQIESANYPFATIEPNVGIVKLRDERIERLAELVKPQKKVYSDFQFVDIAGLVKGASKGEGLGNKFLSNIRNVDAIIHVVRCFEDKNISHVYNSVDPKRDVEIIEMELMISDIDTLQRRIDKLKGKVHQEKKLKDEFDFLTQLIKRVQAEEKISYKSFTKEEKIILKRLNLHITKPVIFIANIGEEYLTNPEECKHYQVVKTIAKERDCEIVAIVSRMEEEISEIEDENERQEFIDSLGLKYSGLEILTRKAFDLLNLSTFFTVGEIEVRSWTFTKGSFAPVCAGKIHTDIEHGFIKVEVIKYDDFIDCGSELKVKERGKLSIEGKKYVVQDGDICHFRFNV